MTGSDLWKPFGADQKKCGLGGAAPDSEKGCCRSSYECTLSSLMPKGGYPVGKEGFVKRRTFEG